ERWLNTGDLGRQDADGYFWLTGRKKELIIRGGHNIDPASIEEPLHRHPAVEVAAAVGRPDLHAGEVPVAYVQLRAGATATAEALMTFARNEINERAAQPKAIRIIDEMPLTGVGKIFKPELRHREIAETLRAALQDAGITVRTLTVENHKVHGTAVNITLPAHTATEQAERILGQFPFFCTLTTAATDT